MPTNHQLQRSNNQRRRIMDKNYPRQLKSNSDRERGAVADAGWRRRVPSLIAATVCILVAAAYFLVIESHSQGTPRVRFIAAYILGLAAAVELGGSGSFRPLRLLLLGWAAAGMFLLGLLTGLVPGFPLLLTGVLTTVAAARLLRLQTVRLPSTLLAVLGGAIAILVLLWGLVSFPW